MRKSIVPNSSVHATLRQPTWLDLERLACVEISAEEAGHPVEEALRIGGGGWRAGASGPQTLRLHFEAPQRLQHIRLHFEERQRVRTQEFVLRWSADGKSFREIVRQQWNFSPSGSTSETETYVVALADVSVLELYIVPDTSAGDARASLTELRIA